jgi:hypothetical protein
MNIRSRRYLVFWHNSSIIVDYSKRVFVVLLEENKSGMGRKLLTFRVELGHLQD